MTAPSMVLSVHHRWYITCASPIINHKGMPYTPYTRIHPPSPHFYLPPHIPTLQPMPISPHSNRMHAVRRLPASQG